MWTGNMQVDAGRGARLGVSVGGLVVSACFLVAGTAVFTYATTRTWTTELVLQHAGGRVAEYLESHNLLRGPTNRDVPIAEDVQLESRALVGIVHGVGGMYYWWNDAIPYWGAGLLLFAVGCSAPFVSRARTRPINESSGD
jgi:hypothetical protein